MILCKDGQIIDAKTAQEIEFFIRHHDYVHAVRCKDCSNTAESVHPNCVVCTNLGVTVREDFFCADGIRKDGDGDA